MDENRRAGPPSGGERASVDAVMHHDPHHATRASLEFSSGTRMISKPGVRGFPELPPGLVEIAPYALDLVAGSDAARPVVIDVSGTAGGLAAVASDALRGNGRFVVYEPSAAALTCATALHSASSRVDVQPGVVWDALEREGGAVADLIFALPPADRGSERVHAELAAAAGLMAERGTLLLALHKDRGGKRYLKDAEQWFERVDTIGRVRGWRIATAREPISEAARDAIAGSHDRNAPWRSFEAGNRTFAALPGVFAAGKLDPGTRILLDTLERHAVGRGVDGRSVLDLGCGYGPISLWAATAGAGVMAVDDDYAAVRSTLASARAHGVRISAHHSDLDAALPDDARFDVVLCNPPFHVGKHVRLDLSHAFVRAAHRRLTSGGTLWLVANRALPYERYLQGWSTFETVEIDGGFKVIRAVR